MVDTYLATWFPAYDCEIAGESIRSVVEGDKE